MHLFYLNFPFSIASISSKKDWAFNLCLVVLNMCQYRLFCIYGDIYLFADFSN